MLVAFFCVINLRYKFNIDFLINDKTKIVAKSKVQLNEYFPFWIIACSLTFTFSIVIKMFHQTTVVHSVARNFLTEVDRNDPRGYPNLI